MHICSQHPAEAHSSTSEILRNVVFVSHNAYRRKLLAKVADINFKPALTNAAQSIRVKHVARKAIAVIISRSILRCRIILKVFFNTLVQLRSYPRAKLGVCASVGVRVA